MRYNAHKIVPNGGEKKYDIDFCVCVCVMVVVSFKNGIPRK